MDDLLDFSEIYDSEFFHEGTVTDTNSSNTIYNKTQKEQIRPINLNIAHFTHYKTSLRNSTPAGNYMFKVNNRNIRARFKICSNITIKPQERRLASFWSLLLTFNIF